jgi:hypothetical protein
VQADEALASIREALSVQYSVKQGKITYGRGVKAATSSTHRIEESRKRAEFHAEPYRKAGTVMTNLLPVLPSNTTDNVLKLFPPLAATDICPLPSAELAIADRGGPEEGRAINYSFVISGGQSNIPGKQGT